MRITASALPRLFRCPGSAALPIANTTSEWAEAGTSRHAEMEDAIEDGNLDEIPAGVRALIPADATSVRAEVAVSYDVATGKGRELGVGIARDYQGLGPFEIPGTIDLLALAPGRALIADWKGWEIVGAPDTNEQTLHNAIAVARAHNIDEVTIAIGYLGRGGVVSAQLDTFEIDAYAGRLRQLHLDVADQVNRAKAGRMPDVYEGAHCKYCPAAHTCPAKVALIRRLISGQETDEMELMLPLTAESARDAYERLQAGKQLLKRIERAIFAFADKDPIPLGDGKWFGKHKTYGNEKLDGDTVYQVVREKFDQETADRAVARKATKAKLKEVLQLASAERDVLDEVRKRGGSKREEKEEVGEFIHTPQLAAGGS